MTSWTPERRAAQSARIRAARPWEKSTGPRTAAGKARSSRNNFKHGRRGQRFRATVKLLNRQAAFCRAVLRGGPVDHNEGLLIQFELLRQLNGIDNDPFTQLVIRTITAEVKYWLSPRRRLYKSHTPPPRKTR